MSKAACMDLKCCCHAICSGYVIVAWIWSALWYLLLDPLKWIMCWILNEDGFRDQVSEKRVRVT
jgi:H+-transporting ATPase